MQYKILKTPIQNSKVNNGIATNSAELLLRSITRLQLFYH